jgi:hypothetical protein
MPANAATPRALHVSRCLSRPHKSPQTELRFAAFRIIADCAGRVSSRVIHAPRRELRVVRGAEVVGESRRATPVLPHWQGGTGPRAVKDPAHARKHLAREPGDPASFCAPLGSEGRRAHREAFGRTTMSHGRGKSDWCVVPKKLPNKAAGETPAGAEAVEGRRQAEGNAIAARMSRRSQWDYDMGTALDGIRQTARGRRGAKFTTLMHHIYAVERLRAAYYALRRDAAAGADGQTWQSYGQTLEANLLDLSERLARGGLSAGAHLPRARHLVGSERTWRASRLTHRRRRHGSFVSKIPHRS